MSGGAQEGRPWPIGLSCVEGGANIAVFSTDAEAIDLCLFTPDGAHETDRIRLPGRTGDVRHGFVPGLRPGQLYGLRAEGPWAPERGLFFNPARLLLDPYARALSGRIDAADPRLLAHDPVRGPQHPGSADSAPATARCVAVAPAAPVPESERPRIPWDRMVIYEAHPKGVSMLREDVPPALRGSFEALAHPAMLAHLTALGVNAVELLPVHAFLDDARLQAMGLRNYWGYNSYGFFAPDPRYFGPRGAAGLRETIRALHEAGIEVILDVVYNHTAEGDWRGPTLSFRGLDNRSYYRLHGGGSNRYIDDTGTGNTVNVAHPFVLRMVLDSLRCWVEDYGVDGFRFDLATTLAREAQGFDPRGGFLDALRQDPILAGVKLIAEPWDIGPGGYQLGGWPAPFAEWNDKFRDGVRRFWRGDSHSAQELAERLLGSAGLFDHAGRAPWASVNFVACHDGFTLADVAAYAEKHNEANGEQNRDGHGANQSDNCGAEGPTQDPAILARRAQRRRNLLTTAFVAQGAPMLLAGDEIANSQQGNNNAYCQDNAIGWVDWPAADAELLAFMQRLIAFRAAHPALRQKLFLHGGAREEDGAPDAVWRNFEGGPVGWRDPGLRRFCLVLRGAAEAPPELRIADVVALAFNGAGEPAALRLPAPPPGRIWRRALDTAAPLAEPAPDDRSTPVAPASIVAFDLVDAPEDAPEDAAADAPADAPAGDAGAP